MSKSSSACAALQFVAAVGLAFALVLVSPAAALASGDQAPLLIELIAACAKQ